MDAFEQIDALRKRNKDLLHKLEKQSEQLHQLTLSCPDKVDEKHSSVYEAFIAEGGPHRAPLKERNGAHPPRASLSTAASAARTTKTPDEWLPGDHEVPKPDAHKTKPNQSLGLSSYSTLLKDTANSRWKGQSRSVRLKLSKSAPLSTFDQRETDSTTTARLEMDTISERNIRPLLGYDWIAGLVDAESSLEDHSEQFFSDLSRFRLANRDECVHSLLSGFPSAADLASSSFSSDEPQPPTDTHQCTFCYRINSRLFAVPLDAQDACPVCKMPKSKHPHTEREPALIRVSIPRSTLLPAHKYKAHRRCSFDPSDSLGLPSHCLSGWSNPSLNSGSQMSSLDLRGSMVKPASTGGSASSWIDHEPDSSLRSATRHRHSDQLQNVTSLPYRSDGTCDTATEYYAKDLGLCCSRCKPGTHLAVMCTSNSDTVCEPCQDGQYSENMNHFSNCFSCPRCKEVKGLMYGTNCSADTKAVCVCKPGMTCSKYNFEKECEECRRSRSCKPGQFVFKEGSSVRCMPCPTGTFSDRTNSEQCKPHTKCEGRSVLRAGDSTVDTLCERMPPSTTAATTTKAPLRSSPKRTSPQKPGSIWGKMQAIQLMNTTTTTTTSTVVLLSRVTTDTAGYQDFMIYCSVGVGIGLVVLILGVMVITCMLRKRKGLQKVPITDDKKVEQDPSASSTPDYQRLLLVDRCQKEPSMTSSDSQSQPDSGHSSADWLDRTSQESLPEQPSVSSPMVNLSITATFNCQLNPTTASCSIPMLTPLTPHAEAAVPLSQEEVCVSCQQEDGKEALRSVQESGLCVF